MGHKWKIADETRHLQDLIDLTENNKHIDIDEPSMFGFGGLQVTEDNWVSLYALYRCSNCGAFMVSDMSGDYSDVIGSDDNCKGELKNVAIIPTTKDDT